VELLDWIVHVDVHLREFVLAHGVLIYALLFAIVFSETGFVVTPFLPGDSLLFAVGALAADHLLDVNLAALTLFVAAVLGNTVNYWIGRWVGPKVFHYEDSRWFRRQHLIEAHAFFEKHGGKAIFLARFVPIVRTFAPFVAGIGKMSYGYFATYNVVGGITWVAIFSLLGYFFGNIPFVQKNFELVIIAIILVSVVPMFVEWWKARREAKVEKSTVVKTAE
jgi:membrane-associated protein